ncbi:MAG: fumarylacetoacetate hydrolase family protein [Bacteroidota bacterium]
MTEQQIQEMAAIVDEAALNAQPVAQLSAQHAFDVDTSYAIQAASLARRYGRGEALIGLKMGFTSEAKMQQMGVHDMIWGRLTDAMLLPSGGTLSLSGFIHPRAEPEVCFRVGEAIDRELSLEEAKEAMDAVAPAIEVIDSRYENFKFSLEDVIADNCSSAALVVGEWQSCDQPLGDLHMDLSVNGAVVQSGSTAAILGDPWKSVVAATRLAAQYGQPIPGGAYLMAGAATSAIFLEAGQTVSTNVEGLGTVGFNVA